MSKRRGKKKGGRIWKKIVGIIGTLAVIIAVEFVGLGQYIASALTADTPEKANIWWITAGIVLIIVTIIEMIYPERR